MEDNLHMRGFQWGYWNYPGGNWVYPPNRINLYPLPFNSYFEGTCASYSALDLRLLDDEELRENVITNIYDDLAIPRSEKENIIVEVKERIVILSGTARDRRTKIRVYADAFQTPGVLDVKNKIIFS